MRKCKICGELKELNKFHKTKKGVDGRDSRCSECKQKLRKKRESLPEKKEYLRTYSKVKNAERTLARRERTKKELEEKESRARLLLGDEYISYQQAVESGITYYNEGLECVHGHISKRSVKNRSCNECLVIRQRTKEHRMKKSKNYFENREERMKKNVEAQRNRYSNNDKYKAAVALRNMLKRVLYQGDNEKIGGSYEMIGYNRDQLMDHISKQFKDGMSWSNYGEWHIDHIKPVSLFVKEGVTEPHIVNALSNLQPLWALENISKRDKFEL